MRRSNNFRCLLWFMMVIPFCSSSDTLRTLSRITYPGARENATLVSASKQFELGFFSPNGDSSSSRYVGIWYYGSNPRIIVWVANRNVPLVGRTASFGLLKGNLQLWKDGQPIWSTNATSSSSSTWVAKLLDTGNLVLMEDDGSERTVWRSFDQPTDTFLPGMQMTDDFKLTSWASQDDPTEGNFTFRRDLGGDAGQYEVIQHLSPYWKSGLYGDSIQADEMFEIISFLLSNFTPTANKKSSLTKINDYSSARLVMNYDGQIQYFNQRAGSKPVWSQPASRCSKFKACGKFQSCNDDNSNETMCRCLPGFELHRTGCLRKSPICEKNDTFLSLKMMKIRKDNQIPVDGEEQCKKRCLNDCNCQAYSFKNNQDNQRRGTGGQNTTCYTWSEDLDNMQELAEDGRDLYVRVPLSDIEYGNRSCGTCGTNLVPYPLSKGQSCGDPLYSAFSCNSTNAQLYFEWHRSSYRVTSIDPEAQTFTIQVNDTFNCTSSGLMEINQQHNQSSPFIVSSSCIGGWNNFSKRDSFGSVRLSEVKIEWITPKGPPCNSSKDCNWPHATCKDASDGMTRCLCDSGFRWNSFNFNCSLGENVDLVN